jgi:HEAT repeat protein
MNDHEKLEKLFQYDEMIRQLEAELLESDDRERLIETLVEATRESLARSEKGAQRLVVLAGLWARVGHEGAASQLVALLNHEDDEVREAAAESLVEVAELYFDDFAKVARELLRGPGPFVPAAAELAFIFTELDDERTVDLILSMLDHPDADVVVAAIQVAGEWGWEEKVAQKLDLLSDDGRTVVILDEEERDIEASVGELASAVVEALGALGSSES